MNQTLRISLSVIITAVITAGGMYYWQNSKTSVPTSIEKNSNKTKDELPIVKNPIEKLEIEKTIETNESMDEIANLKTYSSTGVTIKYPDDIPSKTKDELPIVKNPIEKLEIGKTIETNESMDEIANLKTYSSTGVIIKYPDDIPSKTKDELPIVKNPIEKLEIEKTIETKESIDETTNWKTYSTMGVTIKYPDDISYSIETPETDRFVITQEHPGNRIHVSKTTDPSVLFGNEKIKIINGNSYKVFYREGMGDGYGYVIERNDQFYIFESVWGFENQVFELMMTTVKFN